MDINQQALIPVKDEPEITPATAEAILAAVESPPAPTAKLVDALIQHRNGKVNPKAGSASTFEVNGEVPPTNAVSKES